MSAQTGTLSQTRPGRSNPSAVISHDGQYRYFLSRVLAFDGTIIAFIGLNPSTADARLDDPTIRRCMNFAKSWGGKELWMVNLFAYRSTDPAAIKTAKDPVGPENDGWLDHAIINADVVVAAWGNHGDLFGRHDAIRVRYQGRLQALKITGKGMPSHPLYLSGASALQPFG